MFPHKQVHYTPEAARKEALAAGWRLAANGTGVLCPECPRSARSGRTVFHPVTVIAVACALVREYGWLSAEDAEQRRTQGTADLVISLLSGELRAGRPMVTQADVDQANAAIGWLMRRHQEWLSGTRPDLPKYEKSLAGTIQSCLEDSRGVYLPGFQPPDRTYMYNVMAAVASTAVVYRDGVKKAARKETWQSMQGSKQVGAPGELLENHMLIVTHASSTNRTWGSSTKPRPSHDYKLIDAEGNAFKWWATDKVLTKGMSVLVKRAQIVKHELYEGVTFTWITRCQIEIKG
ncbi:hypothetical protein ACFO0F_33380 [Nonomuraea zeae]